MGILWWKVGGQHGGRVEVGFRKGRGRMDGMEALWWKGGVSVKENGGGRVEIAWRKGGSSVKDGWR